MQQATIMTPHVERIAAAEKDGLFYHSAEAGWVQVSLIELRWYAYRKAWVALVEVRAECGQYKPGTSLSLPDHQVVTRDERATRTA